MKKDITYIIPDIHEKVLWIEQFIGSLNGNYSRIVFLGDYFDSFNSTKDSVERTANWLKYSLSQPDRIHIWGNHDIWYGFPMAEGLVCCGNDIFKQAFINTIIKRKDWDKLVLYHKVNNWYLSHGGISEHHFSHPVFGITDERLQVICNQALELAKHGETHSILRAGYARGGSERVGGIDWLCWTETRPIVGLRQIVGHTHAKLVRYLYVPNKKDQLGMNVCIDCGCRYIGVLTDEEFSVVSNPIIG